MSEEKQEEIKIASETEGAAAGRVDCRINSPPVERGTDCC